MAWVRNNSARLYHVGGVMLTPGQPMEVPDEMLEREDVKGLFEQREGEKMVLERVEKPEEGTVQPVPIGSSPTLSQPQQPAQPASPPPKEPEKK